MTHSSRATDTTTRQFTSALPTSISWKHNSSLLPSIQDLADRMIDFVANQEPKKLYYVQCLRYFKTINDNLHSIREMATDLKRLAGKIDIDDLDDYPMNEDLLLIKRYFLITVRLIFKLLVSVIADNIEHAHNDLVLRSKIIHITNLTSNEFLRVDGFASLHDALISNSVVRVLLLVCLESKSDWTRSLALRTLSVICVTDESLQQFEINSGFKILRDTIVDTQRSEQETKEAISCLASITGPWQRSSESNFKDLKDYAEDFIAGVTKIVEVTESPQAMLICVAVLNNLSRLDSSSVYSVISNKSIAAIRKAFERHSQSEYTIFLLEQITSLIFNMSGNRKSHYHLTNKLILHFLYEIFLSNLNKTVEGAARAKAQRNVARNVVDTVRQLAATSTNYDVESILFKINSRLNVPSQSFDISNSSKNVTKISIYSQETFL